MFGWPTKRSASGPRPPRKATCSFPAIISACEITGAQAIHPGYGFLSENAAFVQAVEDHALTFIGPTAEHIRIMGDKITAKETMKSAGRPMVPGSDGGVGTTRRDGAQGGRAIGYPVIIKATGRRRRARHEGRAQSRPSWKPPSSTQGQRPRPPSATTRSISRNT
jgi:acetyl/propionyl-CoA carboxylase alpha subunit